MIFHDLVRMLGYILYVSSILLLVKSADIEYMKTSIRDHFSDTRHHDPQYSAYKQKAKEYIYNEFVRFGLTTEYHTFQDTNISPSAQFHTVVGILKGTNFGTRNDSIVGLGAHYDTVPTTKGVDDNGSGLAVLLDVARQITAIKNNGIKRKNTIIFASFDVEEYGLVGSRHFVDTWFTNWSTVNYGSRINTAGFIILDTIMEYNNSFGSQKIPDGAEIYFNQTFPETLKSIASDKFRGDFLSLIYRKPTPDADVAKLFVKKWTSIGSPQYELEPFPLPFARESDLPPLQKQLFGNFLRSDHRNFWTNNMAAVFLSDSADFRGDMIHCYHNPCDDLPTMLTDENLNFIGKTADVITMTMDTLSQPDSSVGSRTMFNSYLVIFFIITKGILILIS